jgi:phenylacetic acid degradation operon negative regulatory protein
MTESLARLPGLSAADAARETLLIGQAAIRAINFDPLLPPELGNQQRFLEMAATMRAYSKAGIACWQAYQATATAPSDGG